MSEFMIPLVKVRDVMTGREHIIGTDSHDALLIENEQLVYYNLQSGESSHTTGAYVFVCNNDVRNYAPFDRYIEFVTIEEYIKLLTDEASNQYDSELELQKIFKRLEEYDKNRKL